MTHLQFEPVPGCTGITTPRTCSDCFDLLLVKVIKHPYKITNNLRTLSAFWNLTRLKKQEEEVETMCVTIEAVIKAVVVVVVELSPRWMM